jgi:hypothetical protein
MNRSEPTAALDLTDAGRQRVHQAIDEVLDDLQSRIERQRPDVTCRSETVHTPHFEFNYRAFDPPAGSADRESIVVGVRIEQGQDKARLTGDICTEEGGRILYDEGCCREVPDSPEPVAAAAAALARRLAAQWTLILEHFA